MFNDATRSVLEDIFLLKRLTTMQEFFSLCGQVARGVTAVHDDDHLNKPIRRFTADYVSRQLLGVTSQTLALALCLLLHRIGLNVTGNAFSSRTKHREMCLQVQMCNMICIMWFTGEGRKSKY